MTDEEIRAAYDMLAESIPKKVVAYAGRVARTRDYLERALPALEAARRDKAAAIEDGRKAVEKARRERGELRAEMIQKLEAARRERDEARNDYDTWRGNANEATAECERLRARVAELANQLGERAHVRWTCPHCGNMVDGQEHCACESVQGDG